MAELIGISNLTESTVFSSDDYFPFLDSSDKAQGQNGSTRKGKFSNFSQASYLLSATSSNDDIAINAALTALASAGGGILHLKKGNYSLANAIDIPGNNITIQGEGKATYLKLIDGVNIHGITIAGRDNVTIRDLYLDANGQNASGTSGNHAIRIGQASSNIYIINCKVTNAPHHVINSVLDTNYSLNKNVQILNCELSGNGSGLGSGGANGVCVAMRAKDGLVQGCFMTDTDFCGIELYADGLACKAIGNTIVWNGKTGSLGAILVGSTHENAVVMGNTIYGTGVSSQAAVKVSSNNYSTIIGNTIRDLSTGFGIWLTGSNNTSVIGNTVKNLTQEGIYVEAKYNTIVGNTITSCLRGISLRPTGLSNEVVGNICRANSNEGILINVSASLNSIKGNHCINNSQASSGASDGINSQAPNCIIEGNHCYDDQNSKTQRNGIRVSGSGVTSSLIQNNYVTGNSSTGMVVSSVGAGNIIRNNQGYVTEASGTGTIPSGSTSVVITHGLSVTPTLKDIGIILGELPTNTAGDIYVDTITSTQFTVHCKNDPGASNLDFGWRAIVL